MKSLWRVMTRYTCGIEYYQAYRLLDVCAENEEKNRETHGGYYSTREEAEKLAERLNKKDA